MSPLRVPPNMLEYEINMWGVVVSVGEQSGGGRLSRSSGFQTLDYSGAAVASAGKSKSKIGMLNTSMRYHQICNAGSWKKYFGEESMCAVMPMNSAPDIDQVAYACSSKNGTMFSTRTHTFLGYYVAVIGPEGYDWYTEDYDSMRNALLKIDNDIRKSGWVLSAIGLSDQWVETGLSLNTGHGYHPFFDRAVHMLEPDPEL